MLEFTHDDPRDNFRLPEGLEEKPDDVRNKDE